VNVEQLKHIVRAASGVTDETVFIVVGSQAALIQHPSLPERMAVSLELDIFPKFKPALAELIEGAIGRDSGFHETFGYYADGVGPKTSRLPADWEERAVRMTGVANDRPVTVIAPEIHDLAASKLLAARDKDFEWLIDGVEHGLIKLEKVQALLEKTDASTAEAALAADRIQRLLREVNSKSDPQ
jgi:hypothetical protein